MIKPLAPTISVIIVNWNGASFLYKCLQSLREQTLSNIQVVLVDNGSSDESIALTRRDFPNVDVIDLGQNFGYAEANNRAAVLSNAEYLLFLNNDTYLDKHALSILAHAADAQPEIAIFAPQQRDFNNTRTLHVGMGLDILGYPCAGKTFYADGAALFIRRHVFHKLGGFDPSYFMFFEEADLCWRAWLWGYQVGNAPKALVFHKAGGTAGSSIADEGPYVTSRVKRRLAHRNQLTTVLKNYAAPTLCAILPIFVIMTMCEVTLLIVTGQGSAVRESYGGAWRDLVRNRRAIREMRQQVQAGRVTSDWSILRRMQWKLGAVQVFLRSGTPKVT